MQAQQIVQRYNDSLVVIKQCLLAVGDSNRLVTSAS